MSGEIERTTYETTNFYGPSGFMGQAIEDYGGYMLVAGRGELKEAIYNPDTDHGNWPTLDECEAELVRLAVQS